MHIFYFKQYILYLIPCFSQRKATFLEISLCKPKVSVVFFWSKIDNDYMIIIWDKIENNFFLASFVSAKTQLTFLKQCYNLYFQKGDHDWYCFGCNNVGEVLPCSDCWRVFHPSCTKEEWTGPTFTCTICRVGISKRRDNVYQEICTSISMKIIIYFNF